MFGNALMMFLIGNLNFFKVSFLKIAVFQTVKISWYNYDLGDYGFNS